MYLGQPHFVLVDSVAPLVIKGRTPTPPEAARYHAKLGCASSSGADEALAVRRAGAGSIALRPHGLPVVPVRHPDRCGFPAQRRYAVGVPLGKGQRFLDVRRLPHHGWLNSVAPGFWHPL